MMTTLVKKYIDRGWSLVKLSGKTPTEKKWTSLPPTKKEEASHFADGNFGIRTGKISKVVVMDIDRKSGGFRTLRELKEEGLYLAGVPKVRTGGGGVHYYFRLPDCVEIRNSAGKLGKGIDIRGEGGQVVAPPSVHPDTKKEYRWLTSPNGSMPDFPRFLIEKLKQEKSDAIHVPTNSVPQGQRNTYLTSRAGSLRTRGFSQEATQAALHEENQAKCNPPLPESEVASIAASVCQYEAGGEHEFFTDMGNARRLVKQYGPNMRYVLQYGWLVWDEKRWRKDDTNQVERWAKEIVRVMLLEAANVSDPDLRDKYVKHNLKSQNDSRIKAMINLAKSELEVVARTSDFDRNPFLFNCLNGTLDLRTGRLREHDSNDMITKIAPVDFDLEATCNKWDSFLDRIMDGNEQLISYLRRCIGYALTGDVGEQCFFILFGPGANGKSVFMETIRALFGDYGSHTPVETLLLKRGDSIPNDVARLASSRFVSAVESSAGRKLAEGLIKQMTGGDTMTARFLHKEFFEFKPEFKLFLATNHKPTISGTDYAIWRRIRLIPFDIKILKHEQDKRLSEKLKKELSGILAWAVRGCLEWQKHGLSEPKIVLKATRDYKSEMDLLADFLTDCCITGDSEWEIKADLYTAYENWAKANHMKPMGSRAFANRMKERGIDDGHKGSRRVWKGVGTRVDGD